jgi:hypothetical protein
MAVNALNPKTENGGLSPAVFLLMPARIESGHDEMD